MHSPASLSPLFHVSSARKTYVERNSRLNRQSQHVFERIAKRVRHGGRIRYAETKAERSCDSNSSVELLNLTTYHTITVQYVQHKISPSANKTEIGLHGCRLLQQCRLLQRQKVRSQHKDTRCNAKDPKKTNNSMSRRFEARPACQIFMWSTKSLQILMIYALRLNNILGGFAPKLPIFLDVFGS